MAAGRPGGRDQETTPPRGSARRDSTSVATGFRVRSLINATFIRHSGMRCHPTRRQYCWYAASVLRTRSSINARRISADVGDQDDGQIPGRRCASETDACVNDDIRCADPHHTISSYDDACG